MKRVFQHPPEAATGRKYWRSVGQLSDSPEFRGWLEREFPQGAAEMQGGEVSRRNFLQLMGASAALAGLSLTSCRRPEKHLVPFTKGVEWSIPGKALFYATSMPGRMGFAPLVVCTYDGRPTKIEGNPLHPATKGVSDVWAQTSILDLYDPERSRDFLHDGQASDAATFDKALTEMMGKAGDGGGVAFLVDGCPSPTRERLRGEIEKKYPKVSWCVYEPSAAPASAVPEMVAQIDKADVIMALDADFLGSSEGTNEGARQFSARRRVDGPESKMNRLYVVENRYTVTGGMADHRLRLPASQMGAFLVALAGHIHGAGDAKTNGLPANSPSAGTERYAEWAREAAADLLAAKGRSLILVGERQPPAIRQQVLRLNAALGNLGKTLFSRPSQQRPSRSIGELARDIDDQKIQALFILGGNPVYNAPADLQWVGLQAKVPTVVRLGCAEDETTKDESGSPRVAWHVPKAHYLEHWGDGLASDGSYTIVQPMILPLYGGWSELDLLARVAGLPKPDGPELVQQTFAQRAGHAPDSIAAWTKFVRDGFLEKSAPALTPLALPGAPAAEDDAHSGAEQIALPATGGDTFEVVLVPDSKMDDGRHANNGWLQELPDPITKLTWDNAALISPFSAKSRGLEDGDMVKVEVENRSMEVPVLIAPGHADNSLSIPLGYGRTVVGRVGHGTGFNAYPLRTTAQPFLLVGAKLTKLGRNYPLAVTQEHGAMEGRGADLTRESGFEKYKEVASAALGAPDGEDAQYYKTLGMDAHTPKNVSLYKHPALSDPYQWGMAVDMNTCTGCSACMVACQAENNIPIVGKEQVIGNREMHWIRTDRYFSVDPEFGNSPDEPEMVSQPMMCQHCENAPCETVCPVNATVHSEDGLNVMAYNRCIGTRYCANNCPFKVRRFNFFDYNQRDVLGRKEGNPFSGLYEWNLVSPKGTPDSIKLQKNPNVTVRMRGVMEKCTFCVQRIQEAKIAAKVHARETSAVKIPTDSFTVACAQACPTESIVFGDIKDPEARVSKLMVRERSYRLLEYLNVSTRVWYLARIRNPNPRMPDAAKLGNFIKPHHHGGEHAEPAEAAAGGHS